MVFSEIKRDATACGWQRVDECLSVLERSNNASLSLVEQEGSEKVILLGALIVVVLLDYHSNVV
jgi:hypothetical protein